MWRLALDGIRATSKAVAFGQDDLRPFGLDHIVAVELHMEELELVEACRSIPLDAYVCPRARTALDRRLVLERVNDRRFKQG